MQKIKGKGSVFFGNNATDIIKSNQNITIVEIAQLLNISTTATENNIKKLKSYGFLSRESADKKGHWQILMQIKDE